MEIIKTMTTFFVTQNQEIEIVKKESAENSVSVIAKSEREAANDEGTGRAKMPKTIQRDFLVAHRYTICNGISVRSPRGLADSHCLPVAVKFLSPY